MSTVLISVEGAVARVTLNRPDRRNALNAQLVSELRAAFSRFEEDPVVRAIVLGGEGPAFSAGADLESLERLQSASAMDDLADSTRLSELFEQIYLHPKPVIARVHGAALAGGCGLAAVCDFAVAGESARLGFPEVRIGFVPAVVMVFAARKLGEAALRDLLLRGAALPAAEAARVGLITRAVPDEELDRAVDALAAEIASETSGSAVALTKRMLAAVPGMGLSEALAHARQVNAFARATPDCRAGVSAFLKKQPPPWKQGG